jgi:toxin ParE1/3/4
LKPLVFHPAAEAEVAEAGAFYEDRRRGLGSALRRELKRSLRLIGRSPTAAPRFEGTVYRFHVLRRFPFVLFYEELEDRVPLPVPMDVDGRATGCIAVRTSV